jgi:hypothetical protein
MGSKLSIHGREIPLEILHTIVPFIDLHSWSAIHLVSKTVLVAPISSFLTF